MLTTFLGHDFSARPFPYGVGSLRKKQGILTKQSRQFLPCLRIYYPSQSSYLCEYNRLIVPYNKKRRLFFREEIVVIVCIWHNFCSYYQDNKKNNTYAII